MNKLTSEQLANVMDNIHLLEFALFVVAMALLLWFVGMIWAEAPKREYWRQREAELDREEAALNNREY